MCNVYNITGSVNDSACTVQHNAPVQVDEQGQSFCSAVLIPRHVVLMWMPCGGMHRWTLCSRCHSRLGRCAAEVDGQGVTDHEVGVKGQRERVIYEDKAFIRSPVVSQHYHPQYGMGRCGWSSGANRV